MGWAGPSFGCKSSPLPGYPINDSKTLTDPCSGRNIEANLIIICPSLPFLRQFLRHHTPRWIGDASSSGYFFSREYLSSSFGRNRRQNGAFRLQDEVALTDTANSTSHNEPKIVKEVQWRVTEERVGGSADKTLPSDAIS